MSAPVVASALREADDRDIILFDGVCNLCNGAVTFVIAHDPRDHFRFASLQSEVGVKLLGDLSGTPPDSIVLLEKGKRYLRSDAALRIARNLSGGCSLLYPLIVLPRWIRDTIYDLVARNRYRWFGKREACMVPSPDLSGKFLD